jgi:hypothetical protein
VRFLDGVEESLKPDQLVMLAKFKEGEIGDAALVPHDHCSRFIANLMNACQVAE